ncbi:MAG: hypothetical protein M1823_007522, partial [Watsoniomyces obsoletus]
HARLVNVLKSPPSKNPLISKIFSSASRPSSRAASPAPGPKASAGPPPDSRDQDESGGGDTPSPTPRVHADPGPGAYLARWQDLLDKTPITPQTQTGSVRTASSKDVVRESAVDVDGVKMVEFGDGVAGGENIRVRMEEAGGEGDAGEDVEEGNGGDGKGMKGGKPNVSVVIEALGDGFRRLLAEK